MPASSCENGVLADDRAIWPVRRIAEVPPFR